MITTRATSTNSASGAVLAFPLVHESSSGSSSCRGLPPGPGEGGRGVAGSGVTGWAAVATVVGVAAAKVVGCARWDGEGWGDLVHGRGPFGDLGGAAQLDQGDAELE